MTEKLETLDPSALTDISAGVTYNCKPETVTLPSGVVSVAGVTVVTGGTEMSCGSCILAFGFWGTLVSFSYISVGLWNQFTQLNGESSHLLGLGFVILVLSFVPMASVAVYYLMTKNKRNIRKSEREDGKEVLVESGRKIKKVTV